MSRIKPLSKIDQFGMWSGICLLNWNSFILFYRSCYWHLGSEPEIECKDDLSIPADAIFKADPYFYNVEINWAGNLFAVNPSWCERGSEEQEDDAGKTTLGRNSL